MGELKKRENTEINGYPRKGWLCFRDLKRMLDESLTH